MLDRGDGVVLDDDAGRLQEGVWQDDAPARQDQTRHGSLRRDLTPQRAQALRPYLRGEGEHTLTPALSQGKGEPVGAQGLRPPDSPPSRTEEGPGVGDSSTPAQEMGDASSTAPGVRSSPAERFQREGEYWTIAYDGAVVRLKDSKGLRQIALLLAQPGRELHATDLESMVGGASEPSAPAMKSRAMSAM